MFRLCLSLLIAVAYLAGQLTAVPHAHAGESGHCGTRHVHFDNWTGSSHAHEHGHHEHGHESHSPGDHDGSSHGSHDSNCVHLPDADQGLAASKVIPCDFDELAVAVCLDQVEDGQELTLRRTAVSDSLADRFSTGCALYLQLRALRI